MNYSYDRFSHIKDYHLRDPDKVRAKTTFPETVMKARNYGQTKPFVADQNGCILTGHEEFAALEDLRHVEISVVQWRSTEPIDLAMARSVVAGIMSVYRKQGELRAAVDLLRIAEVDRKSVELDLARFHVSMSGGLR